MKIVLILFLLVSLCFASLPYSAGPDYYTIATDGDCKSEEDFRYNDNPNFRHLALRYPLQFGFISEAYLMPSTLLVSRLYLSELSLLAGIAGLNAVQHFVNGGGRTVTHGPTSWLIRNIKRSSVFQQALSNNLDRIDEKIKTWRSTHPIDTPSLQQLSQLGTISMDRPSFPFGRLRFDQTAARDRALKAIVGGTQGGKMFIRNLTFNGDSFSYNYIMWLCDDFGVSFDDGYSPALGAFYVLQHFRGGSNNKYRPFMRSMPVTGFHGNRLSNI